MLKLVLLSFSLYQSTALCSVSHQQLWKCALGEKCLNVYHLHSIASKKSQKSHLQRPYIMAIEGPKYKRLYDDCDTNKDGCIDIADIDTAGEKCQRSCLWRTTMKSMLCHDTQYRQTGQVL